MILFLHIPDKYAFVHAGWNQETWVRSPTKVKNIFSMTHKTGLSWPSHDPLGPIYWKAVLPLLPNSNAPVIRTRGQKCSVRRVAHNICVFIGITKPVKNSQVFILGTHRVAIVDNLPDLDTTLCALALFLNELLLVWACTCQLKIERMKVDRENAIFGAVPSYLRRFNPHFGGF